MKNYMKYDLNVNV